MKPFTLNFLPVALAAALLCPTPGYAILGFLKKDKKDEISTTDVELDAQEQAAQELYRKAKEKADAGRYESAREIFEDIVKKYPLTSYSAQAQFNIGAMLELDEKSSKAFDAYQTFIERYKNSSLFSSAVERQFDIARKGFKQEKTDSFLGINYKLQPSRLIEMFTAIAKNAPYSKYAPLAQYALGEIHADTDNVPESIAAYQQVVSDYPKSPKAAEAQFQIGQLLTNASQKGNNDQAHLRKTREAYEEFLIQFPENNLASEAKNQLSEIETQEAAKTFKIGEFYEKQGKLKAAAIYYKEVLKYPGAEEYNEAKARLNEIGAAGEIEAGTTPASNKVAAVPAEFDVKSRKDYLGPPPPKLAKVSTRRSMRNSMDDFVPMPVVEPKLPQSPTASQQNDSLLPLLPPIAPSPSSITPAEPSTGDTLLPIPPPPEFEDAPEIKIIKSAGE